MKANKDLWVFSICFLFVGCLAAQDTNKPSALTDHSFGNYWKEGFPRACLDVYKKADLPQDSYKDIAVIGRVKNPGVFAWKDRVTFTQAIEKCGGFDGWAMQEHIGIWKNSIGQMQIVNARAILAKEKDAVDPVLERGDIVIVLEKRIGF